MNRMKKFASIMLALVMAFALMAPAFASQTNNTGTGSITIQNASKGHTYKAYRIFSGTLSSTGGATEGGNLQNEVLSDISWGSGVDTSKLATALADSSFNTTVLVDGIPSAAEVVKKLTTTDNGTAIPETERDALAREFAKVINDALSSTKETGTTVEAGTDEEKTYTCTIPNLDFGYYLIKDSAETTNETDQNGFITRFMLQVVGPTTIAAKGEAPKVEKEVADVNDSETPAEGQNAETWSDSADHDIGDTVKFKLTATLPSNYDDYKTYKLVFHDTMSEGLTYTENSATVTLGEGENATTINADIEHENGNLTITLDNLKTLCPDAKAGDKIVVNYTAMLNENAQFINDNTVYLEYSNNPNHDGEGEPPTGTTPPTTVVVFTYTAIVNKVDGEQKPLPGAEFTLYKYDADAEGEEKWIQSQTFSANEAGVKFTAKGLDDGWYKLEETETPAGYNTAAPIYFKIEAEHKAGSTGEAAGTVTIFKITVTDENGDALTGANVPAFTITNTPTTGEFDTTVVNNKGATLPETGGVGTTIFYALGGLLTVGAVVLLVTKKRMNADDK